MPWAGFCGQEPFSLSSVGEAFPPPPLQAITVLLSMDFSIQNVSYKWNYIICFLLYVAAFPWHNVFKVHSWHSMFQYSFILMSG